MAAVGTQAAPAANPVKAAPKVVAMAGARVAKDVDAVDAADVAAMEATARAVHSASALTPKASPCWRMPTCQARTLAQWSPAVRSNALTADRARSVATALAVVASAMKVANVASRVPRAVPKAHQQQQAAPIAEATKPKPAKDVNHASPVKAAVAAVDEADADRAPTVKCAMPTARVRPASHQPTSKRLPMTAAPQRLHAATMANPVKSAAVNAPDVTAVLAANGKSALICASPHSRWRPRPTLRRLRQPPQCRCPSHA